MNKMKIEIAGTIKKYIQGKVRLLNCKIAQANHKFFNTQFVEMLHI